MSTAQSQQPMQTTFCPFCSVQLSYPQGSLFIQCPKCRNTMNPQAPQQTPCGHCGILLAHPANSLYIQCPKCLFTMNPREQRSNSNFAGGTAGTQTIPPNYPQYVPAPINTKKTVKKRKDPSAPKAASNAYMIYCKEKRAKLKEEHPELPFGKLGAKLGEMWRLMSAEEKKPYEERAAQDRDRYRKEMSDYTNEIASNEPTPTKKKADTTSTTPNQSSTEQKQTTQKPAKGPKSAKKEKKSTAAAAGGGGESSASAPTSTPSSNQAAPSGTSDAGSTPNPGPSEDGSEDAEDYDDEDDDGDSNE